LWCLPGGAMGKRRSSQVEHAKLMAPAIGLRDACMICGSYSESIKNCATLMRNAKRQQQ
jgi:hypothetical protein